MKRVLKIFLVEDELIIRENIKKSIDWESYGFEFLGDAGDGELAYPMIIKLQPDIVITDIKMPFMDGLELSRAIKKEMPKVKIIILSGYGEFSYAKEALNIGVTDYLLKPVDAVTLMETLDKVGEIIYRERAEEESINQYKLEMEENAANSKRHFFMELCTKVLDEEYIAHKSSRLNMELKANFYNIILLKLFCAELEFAAYSEELFNAEKELFIRFANHPRYQYFDHLIIGSALLIKGNSIDELETLQEEAIERILNGVENNRGVNYFIAVGIPAASTSELIKSFNEANRALAYRHMLKPDQVVQADHLASYQHIFQSNDLILSEIDVKQLDERIVGNFIASGDKGEVSVFIDEYLKGIGESALNSYMFRQYLVIDFYFAVLRFAKKFGYNQENIEDISQDQGKMNAVIGSVPETIDYLKGLLVQAVELRDSVSTKKYRKLIEVAKAYIRENYAKEDISLKEAACIVNVSPSHFSTIFSKEEGKTFSEYLTQVRMTKAKELLRCTNMRASEIGYEVGYKDPHYFSFMFKKTQNRTPKDYRTAALTGEEKQQEEC